MEGDNLFDYDPSDGGGFDYANSYNAQRPYRSARYSDEPAFVAVPQPSSSNDSLWSRLLQLADFATGPRFAFVVAISVVLLFHFQEPLLYQWRLFFPAEQTLWDSVCELWWCLHDYTRALVQMGMECLRRLVQSDSEHATGPLSPMRNRVQRRRIRREAGSSMPDLEYVSEVERKESPASVAAASSLVEPLSASTASNGPTTATGSDIIARESVRRQANGTAAAAVHVPTEIEPAFLKESDYPPDWMVYHTVLGVVTKTEADRYDREQRETTVATRAVTNDGTGRNGNYQNGNHNANGCSAGQGANPRREQPQEEQRGQPALQSIAATG